MAACSTRPSSVLPESAFSRSASTASIRDLVPNLTGTYKGSVTETINGRSVTDPLKLVIKQSGSKFTGIFDIILKTVSDEFPIKHGVVSVAQGKTILHFVIEGSPGRNAHATAVLAGSRIKGAARVPPRNGPAVRLKYSARKT